MEAHRHGPTTRQPTASSKSHPRDHSWPISDQSAPLFPDGFGGIHLASPSHLCVHITIMNMAKKRWEGGSRVVINSFEVYTLISDSVIF
ncbi:unnamed protein product [Boreogadus saida]